MANTKKTKQELFFIFMCVFSVFTIVCLMSTFTFIASSNSRKVNIDIDNKTQELSITSDKNIPEISIELKIKTKEFGTKTENIIVKELKAYETKKLVPETQLLSSKNVTIEDIKCSGTILPFEDSMLFILKISGAIAIISFVIALIFSL